MDDFYYFFYSKKITNNREKKVDKKITDIILPILYVFFLTYVYSTRRFESFRCGVALMVDVFFVFFAIVVAMLRHEAF